MRVIYCADDVSPANSRLSMRTVRRRRLAELARDPQKRRVGGAGRPHRWRPNEVPDPVTGYGMTDAAAWALVAKSIEDVNVKITKLKLKKPPGCIAYVMNIEIYEYSKTIYIKFEFLTDDNSDFICARSFHT